MTGMPGFEKALSTTQMWQVSVLLANFDKVPQSIKDSLTAPPPMPTPASPAVSPETKSPKKM